MATVWRPGNDAPPELLARAAANLETLFASTDLGIWIQPTLQGGKRRSQPDLILGGPGAQPAVMLVLPWSELRHVDRRALQELNKAGSLFREHLQRIPGAGDIVPRTLLWLPHLPQDLASEALGDHLQDVVVTKEQSTADILESVILSGKGLSVDALRAAVEPQLHFFDLRDEVVTEPVSETPPAAFQKEWGFFLDRKQERMACELASPRTLVYGPAGSGKTVFLMARAQYWMREKPGARVLLTCYNASLAAHMRRSLKLKGMDPDHPSLTVLHYHDLCREILDLGLEFHEQKPEFYASLEPRVLKQLSSQDEAPTFDLILVDEGQDFSRRMFEVLVRLSESGGEITVVADPAQDIYLRWSEANLEPLGSYETERLVDCYRNTAPIFGLARAVIPTEARKALGLNRLELTRPEDLGRDGPPPQFVELTSLDQWVDHIEGVCRRMQEDGKPLSQIAILYTDRHAIPDFPKRLRTSNWEEASKAHEYATSDQDDLSPSLRTGSLNPQEIQEAKAPKHFVEALLPELARRHLPVEWITKDFETKAAFDIQKPRMVISTIHSAKGMDFDTVLLIGAEALTDEQDSRAPALLFAGITRAREMLHLLHFRPTGWIPKLARAARAVPCA